MTAFDGFGPKVRRWFQGLQADNSREYFAAHRDVFEESVRGQMEALLTELSDEFGGEVKLFRQNRDIRFSPDKSPYKTNTYGVVCGSELAAQGLYASISARGLVAGSGYHVMARDQLERYRDAVADDTRGARAGASSRPRRSRPGLELWGESLATAPRGYPTAHKRIELLRRKSLSLGATLTFGRGIGRADGLRLRRPDMARGSARHGLARRARSAPPRSRCSAGAGDAGADADDPAGTAGERGGAALRGGGGRRRGRARTVAGRAVAGLGLCPGLGLGGGVPQRGERRWGASRSWSAEGSSSQTWAPAAWAASPPGAHGARNSAPTAGGWRTRGGHRTTAAAPS